LVLNASGIKLDFIIIPFDVFLPAIVAVIAIAIFADILLAYV
jgi:hypothetical protein